MSDDRFVFRKTDKVGVADARMDKNTLLSNFIDTGDYSVLKDMEKPERFILGRAGVGKTALITKLQDDKDNVILIEPEDLSLGYISNSTIIQNLTELGVDFSLFYRMLWRHVLVVEILKHHFGISDNEAQLNFIDKLKSKFSQNKQTKAHIKALDYMEKWGDEFWQDTNHRIKEIKDTIESELKGGIGVGIDSIKASAEAKSKLTTEQKSEITHKAQDIVNSVQMKELSGMMKLLDDAIDDRQKKYYLVIDRLDENWVDESIRYELIMALIETVKDFGVVEQIKPMVVLRDDLLSKVYDETRRSGFQEEKFATLNLHVSWTKRQIVEMLDSRINYLIKSRYTKQIVTHKEMLPETVLGVKTIDYMTKRTLMRPRDLIDFFNHCIKQATDSTDIDEGMIIKAERDYSRARRSAIRDEWFSEYPDLLKWDTLLESLNKDFFTSDINNDEIEKIALSSSEVTANSRLDEVRKRFLEEKVTINDLRINLIVAFYAVGYIGVELANGATYWSYENTKTLHKEEINDDTILKIHPMFYSCFNIKDVN